MILKTRILCWIGCHDFFSITREYRRCKNCRGTSEWIYDHWDFLPAAWTGDDVKEFTPKPTPLKQYVLGRQH